MYKDGYMLEKKLSPTKLAQKYGVPINDIFSSLDKLGYISRDNDHWILTDKGKTHGGEERIYKEKPYIAWPENIELGLKNKSPLLTSTKIGVSLEISARKVNSILSEIGWIKRGEIKGWKLTEQGAKQGGVQFEEQKSGAPYVSWPESILESKVLLESVLQIKGSIENTGNESDKKTTIGFRDKFEAKFRTADGHFVRSKAEMLIDNWLYMAEIIHAYERKLPVEEDVYCDFYIPSGKKVYIEYWGYENDPKYLARKKQKQDIYTRYEFNLIELSDNDVKNLDDVLPKLLLEYDIKSY